MWIRRISISFNEIFSHLKDLETDFAIFSNPISIIVKVVPQKYQMELIELQCITIATELQCTMKTNWVTVYYESLHYDRAQNQVLDSFIISQRKNTGYVVGE